MFLSSGCRMNILSATFIVLIVAGVVVLPPAASSVDARRTPVDSFIVGTFRRRQGTGASYVMEALHDLLGSDLCFTERGSTSLIQLCLEHGFRRLEVERFVAERDAFTSSFVVSSKKKKSVLFGSDENSHDDDDDTSDDDKKNHVPLELSVKNSKRIAIQESMSQYLREELENLFAAAAAPPYDEAFFGGGGSSGKDTRYASPFRSDYPRRDPSALANITMEIYGRFVPSVSKLHVDHAKGVASMIFPNGDPCYHHHEYDSSSSSSSSSSGAEEVQDRYHNDNVHGAGGGGVPTWTTHFKMLCSTTADSAGRAASRGATTASGDPVRWDVRVNAPQCMVVVLVYSDIVC